MPGGLKGAIMYVYSEIYEIDIAGTFVGAEGLFFWVVSSESVMKSDKESRFVCCV